MRMFPPAVTPLAILTHSLQQEAARGRKDLPGLVTQESC